MLFAIDDALIIFGILCIAASIGLLLNYIDNLFLVEALVMGSSEIYTELPNDFIQRAYDYSELSIISLMCAWGTIVIPADLANKVKCGHGENAKYVLDYAISHMILDIFSDLTILVIPVRLVWQIKVRWIQKIALGFSLCLTIAMIALTIIRVSGLRYGSAFDSAWGVYWLIVSGEAGLILTTGTAFRALFVSRNQKLAGTPLPKDSSKIFTKTKDLLRLIVTPKKWRTRQSSGTNGNIDSARAHDETHKMMELPGIERGTMTGIRTSINGKGSSMNMSSIRASQAINSPAVEEEDGWPSSEQQQSIKVQHQICTTSERAGLQESHIPVMDRDMV
ncbi:hypothetical protein NHQ30_006661 [Ciborinia camelliae]|nr:hypothetical protein NHQ30_006661 [Ciborinia camelliae]